MAGQQSAKTTQATDTTTAGAGKKKTPQAGSTAAIADSVKKKTAPRRPRAGARAKSAAATTTSRRQSLAEPVGGATAASRGAMTSFAAPTALVVVPPSLDTGQAREMGVVAGTVDGQSSPTAGIGAGATDLCEIAPSGQVAVAGDTWRGSRALGPWLEWSPSLALHVSSLADKVQFDKSFGRHGKLYQDGWRELHDNGVWGPDTGIPTGGCSQLPAGTVGVGKKNYLLVTRTKPGLKPQDSRLVEISADKPGWPTVPGSEKPASYENFNQTQISGCEGPPGPEEIANGAQNREDGWVYIVADNFDRSKPVVLYRCRPETFTDRDSWRGWGMVDGDPSNWAWGQTPEPLNADLKFGELSLRRLRDSFGNRKYVLSAFNLTTGQIEVRVADDVRQILRPYDPSRPDIPEPPCTVVASARELPILDGGCIVPQLPFLYGGYIVPGSTLDRTRILVSQWAQYKDDQDRYCGLPFPYDVREYEVNLKR